jgi:hypothetical protein
MSRKKPERRPCAEAAAPKLPIADEASRLPTASPQLLRMRLGAGRHAVKAAEVEIHIEGIRLIGGTALSSSTFTPRRGSTSL